MTRPAQSRPRSVLVALLTLTLMCGAGANALADDDAEALADKMLEHLGGRAEWAALRNTVNGSHQYRAVEPTVVYSVIYMDFERPRFRIETTGRDLHLIRVVDGDNSWRINLAGELQDLPADRYEGEMRWYGAHIYRTIHRVAAGDPAISLGLADDGRLEIYEDDQRLVWLRLDAKGEPYAFGFYEDEVDSLCGPWDVIRDGIRHPSWVSSADGTWRAAIKALEFNVPFHDSQFERPARGF